MSRQIYNDTWASGGDIVDPGGVKISTGWVVEAPPHEYFNFWQGKTDEMLQHLERNGIAEFDSSSIYVLGGYTREGTITYRSLVSNNTGNLPSTSPAQWVQAFLIPGNNLSDIPNVATARTNLDVYSKGEADSNFLDAASNLSDLANTTTSRTNLGVYSTTEVYSKSESDANYLPIAGKAADSELLDGVDGATFARRDQTNTFAADQTIKDSVATTSLSLDADTGFDTEILFKENAISRGSVFYDESADELVLVKFASDGFTVKSKISLKDSGIVDVAVGTLTRAGNTVWDAGNDGAGSGLDADLFEGKEGTRFVDQDSTTGAATLPTGTTAERPVTPSEGMFRRNTTTGSFEGYDGSSWTGVGGASGGGGNPVFYENDTNVTVDYTVSTGKNAMSAGPITINNGITVTVPSGSVWTIVGG